MRKMFTSRSLILVESKPGLTTLRIATASDSGICPRQSAKGPNAVGARAMRQLAVGGRDRHSGSRLLRRGQMTSSRLIDQRRSDSLGF